MKATGVVRRIDDLGRVVIPKEIRKTLRIKEGDPLEIFTEKDGGIILRKYSPIGELTEFATGYAETLSKTTGHIAFINVSDELEQLMEDKEIYTSKDNSDLAMPITQSDKEKKDKIYNSQVVYPIISNGDTIGTVILLSKQSNIKMNEVEKKVAQSAATFLGSQMEI